MSVALQGKLLDELLDSGPQQGQLWIATHSIGMMRRAMQLYVNSPTQVIFLDFEGQDFDLPLICIESHPIDPFGSELCK